MTHLLWFLFASDPRNDGTLIERLSGFLRKEIDAARLTE